MMLDPAIAAFFSERKEGWLKKKLKPNMTEIEIQEVEIECENIFSLENWLPKAAKRITSRAVSTHPSKFSHPSTGVGEKNKKNFTFVTPTIFNGVKKNDGYLKSGNVTNLPLDSLGNAAELDVEDFLFLQLSDGEKLVDHLVKDSAVAKSILNIKSESYDSLRNSFMGLVRNSTEVITSSKIKQVYFPVDSDYHQLSVLSNSGMIFELRRRIDALRFSDLVKQGREQRRNNEYSEAGYSEIYDITTIGYGGTKPQNVSVLNNQYGGKAHLLLSVPPFIEQRDIKFPTKDFFLQSLRYYDCKEAIERLDNIFRIEREGQIPLDKIRKGRDRCLSDILDVILQKMMAIREVSEQQFRLGDNDLHEFQKIWLCEQLKEQRLTDEVWLDRLCEQISGWIHDAYKKLIKNPVMLGEAERSYFKDFVDNNREVLR